MLQTTNFDKLLYEH